MKTLLCCLMLASVPAFSQTLKKDQPQLEATSDPEVFVQKLKDGKHQIEYLFGNRAKIEAYAVEARYKNMFNKETEESKKFGQDWTPKRDHMIVARWMKIPDGLAASTTIQNAKGMVIFYPFDDGNPATFETKMYIEDYVHPYAAMDKYQMKIPKSGAYSFVNYARTWEKIGGKDGIPPKNPVDHKYLPDGSEVQLVWGQLRSGADYRSCWLEDVTKGCAIGVVGCAVTGPLWAKCFAIECTAVMVGSIIGCLWVF